MWGLGIAVCYGALEQGAFYRGPLLTVVAAVALGLGGWCLIGRSRRTRMTPSHRLAAACWAALAGWALVSALVAGDPAGAVPLATVSLMLSAALVAVSGLDPDHRRTLHHVIVVAGVVVAVSAWAGVALHREPWALPSQSLWRGSSTLTYANATAAFLIAPLLLVARRLVRHGSVIDAALLTVMAVGWVSTLSRGGAVSALVGVVLAVAVARRAGADGALWSRTVRRLGPVVPGAVVSVVALVPSLPEADPAQPALATAGLLAGVTLSWILLQRARRPSRSPRQTKVAAGKLSVRMATGLIVAVAALSGLVGLTIGRSIAETAASVFETRLERSSSARSDLRTVTWRQFVEHPFLGVGPSQLNLQYVSSDGDEVQAEFTHNEYLQLAAEVGIPGLVLAVVGMAAVAWPLWGKSRCHRSMTAETRAAGAGMIAAFAVHSSLDFLWHLPAISLLVVLTTSSLPNGDSEPAPTLLRSAPA